MSNLSDWVIAKAPILYWRLGEPSGTTVNDASGNSRIGAYAGSPTLGATGGVVGDSDTAVTFDGTDDSAIRVSADVTAYPVTIAALLKTPGSTSADTNYCICGLSNSGSTSNYLYVAMSTDGSNDVHARIFVTSGGTEQTTLVLSKDTYYTVVCVFASATDRKIYVNAVLQNSFVASLSFPSIDATSVGAIYTSSLQYRSGTVDEFVLDDATWSLDDIKLFHIYAIDAVYALSDTLSLSDTATDTKWEVESVSHSFSFSDAVLDYGGARFDITDILSLSKTINGQIAGTNSTTDSIFFFSTAQEYFDFLVQQTCSFSSSLGVVKDSYTPIISLLSLTNNIVEQLATAPSLSASLLLEDTVTNNLEAINSLTGELGFSSVILVTLNLAGEVYIGLAINLSNFALSEYYGWDFNSMFEIDGHYYGANADGVFEMLGTDDAGTDIQAILKLHVTDFGIKNKKRLPEIVIFCRNDDKAIVKVTHTKDDGTKETNFYETKLNTDAFRAHRVVLKKGLKSENWQIEIRNTNGAALDIDRITLNPVDIQGRA